MFYFCFVRPKRFLSISRQTTAPDFSRPKIKVNALEFDSIIVKLFVFELLTSYYFYQFLDLFSLIELASFLFHSITTRLVN